MTRKYQRYTQEFKLEAIRLMSESERPVVQIARELGIRVNQIYKWKKQLDEKSSQAFSRTAKASEANDASTVNMEAEIKALKLQIEKKHGVRKSTGSGLAFTHHIQMKLIK